jgi:hypothetical protein
MLTFGDVDWKLLLFGANAFDSGKYRVFIKPVAG